MNAFLSWIYAQAAKVYDWFGDAYASLKNAAAHAWDWAVERGQAAYNAARSYAYDLALDVYNAAVSYVNSVYNSALRSIDDAVSYAYNVGNWVTSRIQDVYSYADSVRDHVMTWAYGIIQDVANSVFVMLDIAKDYAASLFNNVWEVIQSVNDRLNDFLSIFTLDTLDYILAAIGSLKNGVLAFLDNPLVFILDIVWEKFVSFFCFVMAHALGTTKYELPYKAPWKD